MGCGRAIFRWSGSDGLMRVITCDGDVVMYDTWWSHLAGWGLADLPKVKRGSVSYYVVRAAVMEKPRSYDQSR